MFGKDDRIKRVEKALKTVEDMLDEHHELLLNLKKRVMSLEGKNARQSALSMTERKLLEELLGGKVVAIGDSSDGDRAVETETAEHSS
jgi:hypothetical protein